MNLQEAEMDRGQAARVVERLLWNVELMLNCDVVHGDLSPFNILWWKDRAVVIDFPQAVDPRLNPAAEGLLMRDVENVCAWGRKLGVERDGARIGRELWRRFREGELG